ncbi:MAG: tetraacyldisaccharide 4'-kinase [Pyrinomonadaceae bacterium]|nr:tetraacyldisaccharide 4'-kinase [Pyrinomonadaceae bacterium]
MLDRLYGKIQNLRNSFYEKGIFASHSLGAKTVSVGNITVGGTGKTPLVALVAEILAEKGEKVCILSRGYGRKNPKSRVLVSDGEKVLVEAAFAGDEPFELANKLRGKAVVISDANRVSAAKFAVEKFGVSAFVLDDAFQHQKAKRDLNIVCVDATNPFGNGKILPFGILREPLENLKRADAVVITRANLSNKVEDLKIEIAKYTNCPVFISNNKISNLTDLKNFPAKTKSQIPNPKSQIVFAFCALGNPDNFFEQLKSENFNLVSAQKFPDHHFYTRKDIAEIENSAKKSGAQILLTTAKDAVKLKNVKFELPCFVVESEIFFEDEKRFRQLLENVFD